jgi:hypothetical protein
MKPKSSSLQIPEVKTSKEMLEFLKKAVSSGVCERKNTGDHVQKIVRH